jgi:urease accessory protein
LRGGRLPLAWHTVPWLALPAGAHAHGAMPGMAGFGSGLVHALVTPAHLLLLMGLALWLAQQQPAHRLRAALALEPPPPPRAAERAPSGGRAALVPFGTGLAVGLLATTQGISAPAVLLPALALAAGLLVAAAVPAPWQLRWGLLAAAGLALGLDSGVDAGAAPTAVAITLLGTWIGAVLYLANGAWYAALLPRVRWVRVGMRVAGSWIAAISLMVLAFIARTLLAST